MKLMVGRVNDRNAARLMGGLADVLEKHPEIDIEKGVRIVLRQTSRCTTVMEVKYTGHGLLAVRVSGVRSQPERWKLVLDMVLSMDEAYKYADIWDFLHDTSVPESRVLH